ncbi:MAG TPA: T9SS type A sorting domain-containing protein, partial [Chitinophagaceae bacterium]
FTKIAGGSTLGVDSVAGWRANSYTLIGAGTYRSKRILLALAPSNQNIAYVFYENGLSQESPQLAPETDFYKIDISGNSYTWTNRSQNMPDFPGGNLSGSDPIATQGGYDMLVAVKPNDPNAVIVGGTNLYRSSDGFATNASGGNMTWINGYNTNFTYSYYLNGHPDQHGFAFNPSNANEVIVGDDGGIRRTTNIMASIVEWSALPNYQTLQYYYVAIDPGEDRNNFAGGAQDNGTLFRDKVGILPTNPTDSNNHRRLVSGDGTSVGISKLELAGQQQYLYGGSQYGNINRVKITNGVQATNIRPNGLTPAFTGATSEWGEFVTNFRLNPDNTEDLYYVNFNRLFRTTAASSVTAGGWTELTGISAEVNPGNPTAGRDIGIRALGFSRGTYATSHALYIGTTNGRVLRLDDPRNAAATTTPIDITPSGISGLNVQDIAVNPNNDDEIMIVITNYGRTVSGSLQNVTNIWWTNNAKSANPTWKQAEGNLGAGFISARSAVIAVKKDASNNPVTEYYVGTAAGLYSVQNLGTTLLANGNPTWQREGGNVLNLAVIQSMSYRPGDNMLLVGTHGNGMYYASLGTPNFIPNQNTGVDPVTNDKNFIRNVFPTLPVNTIQYQTGNMTGVRKITVQLFNMMGQEVMRKEASYQSGNIPVSNLQKGNYILSITSDDGRYRHIQKFIKQ